MDAENRARPTASRSLDCAAALRAFASLGMTAVSQRTRFTTVPKAKGRTTSESFRMGDGAHSLTLSLG